MKWEKSIGKLKTEKLNLSSGKREDEHANERKRATIDDRQFNRISRESLRKDCKQEGNFEAKKDEVMFNTLQQSDSKKISVNMQNSQHERCPSLSLFSSHHNQKYNSQTMSVKSKSKEKNENCYQNKATITDCISPEQDTVIPTIPESISSEYNNKSFDTPFGNSNAFTTVNPYTPTKYTKTKIISLKSSENDFLPEKSPDSKCRPMSLSQINANSSLIKISPFKDLVSEKRYQIQKYRYLRNFHFSTNPKVRDRAGKIIQHWWKRVKSVIIKIIRIQSSWRGYRLKKQLYGIISVTLYYQTFCDKLNSALRKNALRLYFPMLYLRKQSLLLIISKIKLKQYYNRWERKTRRADLIKRIAMRLFILRNRNYETIKSLKAYYHIWVINTQLRLALEDKDREAFNQRTKYTALNNLLNALTKLINGKGLRTIKPALYFYLKNKLKQRRSKMILRRLNKITRVLLKEMLTKWKTNSIRCLYLDLFENTKMNRLSHLINQRHKSEFKCTFSYLKKGLIEELTTKIKKINAKVIIPTATRHLITFAKMKGFKSIKLLLKQTKCSKLIRHNLQTQQKRYSIKTYSKAIIKLRNDERLKKLLLGLVIHLFRLDKSKNQLKYFHKWKLMSQINERRLNECKQLILMKSLRSYITKSVIKTKEIFHRLIEKTEHYKIKAKILLVIINKSNHYAQNNRGNILCCRYRQWKQKAINRKISELKGFFIQNLSEHQLLLRAKFALSKGFNNWRRFNYLFQLNDEFDQRNRVAEGLSILCLLQKKVIKNTMIKLMKIKTHYLKGKRLLSLSKTLSQSLIRLRLSFIQWRLIQMKETFDEHTVNKIASSHHKQIQSIRRGTEKAKQISYQLKCFLKWYYNAIIYNKKSINDFLLHLNEGILNLNRCFSTFHLQESFSQIKKSSVNINNPKLVRLKRIIHNNDKLLLAESWIRLRSVINCIQQSYFKGKAVNRTSFIINQIAKSQILLKRFMLWKHTKYSNKMLSRSIISLFLNYLRQGMIASQLRLGLKNIKIKVKDIKEKESLMFILNKNEVKYHKLLRNILMRWSRGDKKSIQKRKDLLVVEQASNTSSFNNVCSLVNSIENQTKRKAFLVLRRELIYNLRNQKLSGLFYLIVFKTFRRWKHWTNIRIKAMDDLKSFSDFVLENDEMKGKVVKSIIDPLIVVSVEANTFIKKKGEIITEFTKGLVSIRIQMAILRRNIILRTKIESLISKNGLKVGLHFNSLKRSITLKKVNANAQAIQSFCRKKLNLLQTENSHAAILLTNYCQKAIRSHLMFFIGKCSPLSSLEKSMKIHIGEINQDEENKNKVLQYKSVMVKGRNSNNTKTMPNNLLKRIVLNLTIQNEHALKIKLMKWKKIILFRTLTKSCISIQNFFRNQKNYLVEERECDITQIGKCYKSRFNKINKADNSDEHTENDILAQLIGKLSFENTMVLKCKFRQWVNKTQKLLFNYYATSIQQFLLTKLRRLSHSKQLEHLIQVSRIQLYKQFHLLSKINKVYLAMKKISLSGVLQRLKQNVYQLPQLKRTILKIHYNPAKLLLAHFKLFFDQTQQNGSIANKLLQNKQSQMPALLSFVHKLNSQIIQSKNSFLSLLKTAFASERKIKGLINIYHQSLQLALHSYFVKWNNSAAHQKRNQIINALISNLINKRDIQVGYCLIVWKKKALELYFSEQALMIQLFLLKSKKNRKARKNWLKLITFYHLLSKRNAVKLIFKRLKTIFGVTKLNQFNQKKIIMSSLLSWKRSIAISRLNRLSDLLTTTDKELTKNSQLNITNAIYRLCGFKVLSQLIKILQKQLRKWNVLYFLVQLTKYSNLKGMSSFQRTNYGRHKQQLTKLTFKANHFNAKVSSNKLMHLFLILPSFTKFLNQIRIQTIKNGLNEILKHSLPQNSKTQHIITSACPTQYSLKSLINKGVKGILKTLMKDLSVRKRLNLLINITMKHKARIMFKKIRYTLAIWHVYTGLMSIKRTQIQIMENNCVDTYNVLSDQLFGQGVNPNPTVLEELKALYNQMQ